MPPIQIVAAGVCPQLTASGRDSPNTIGCVATSGGGGSWQIVVSDPTVLPNGHCALIVSGGNGSNPTGGVSFGQAQSQTVNGLTLFSFSTYAVATGTALDVESQFIIVKWP
jgi:hypothetical protein